MERIFKHLDTQLIHAGEPEPRIHGAVRMPIFQSAMFEYAGETDYHDLKYIRLNNTPNHTALHRKLTALERGEAALVTSSGMAAISATLLSFLSAGDHLLAQDCLYGGTHDFLTKDFSAFGIAYDFLDADDPASWKSKLRPKTRAVYVETITNPLMQVGDLKAIAEFARANALVSIIDNTFATPVNFRPRCRSCHRPEGSDRSDQAQTGSSGRFPRSSRGVSPPSGDDDSRCARPLPE